MRTVNKVYLAKARRKIRDGIAVLVQTEGDVTLDSGLRSPANAL